MGELIIGNVSESNSSGPTRPFLGVGNPEASKHMLHKEESGFIQSLRTIYQRKRLFSEEKMVGDVGIEPTTR